MTSLLSTDELAAMRSTQDSALPDLAYILRANSSPDDTGIYWATWGTAASNKACRLAPSSNQPTVKPLGTEPITTPYWVITFPVGTDVRVGDRAVISGKNFEVLGVESGFAWNTAVRATCLVIET